MRALPVVAAVLALASCVEDVPPAVKPSQPAGWDAQVKVAEAVDTDPADDVVAVTIEARLATLEMKPGVLTEVWTYDGQIPGPTIHAKKGDRVVVTFTNSLPAPTTIHWHGLRVDAAMDGTPLMQEPVQPGETFVYDLELKDAGTYWYHPHVDSSAQMGFGLYGAFIVEDAATSGPEPKLGDDLVLVLSDMSLDENGALHPGDHQGWFGDFFGRAGNLRLVNGRERPVVLARAGVPQRWRVVNASRSHYQRLALPGQGFTLVAVDGGLVERAVPDANVALPPGARADIVFVPSAPGKTIVVENLGVDRFHVGNELPRTPLFDVQVTADEPGLGADIPDPLASIPSLDVGGAPEQTVSLDTVLADDGNTYFGINGVLDVDHEHGVEPFHASVNTTEVWTLKNTTNMDHPFHLHGFFFQVLDVNGEPPAVRGWLDTVNLEPQQVVRIAIPFDDRAGMWMFHCHILDHADTGMMRTLMVE